MTVCWVTFESDWRSSYPLLLLGSGNNVNSNYPSISFNSNSQL